MTPKPRTRKAPAADPIFALIAEHKPMTPAGAAAMITYIRRDIDGGLGAIAEWHVTAWKTCAAALARMGKAA